MRLKVKGVVFDLSLRKQVCKIDVIRQYLGKELKHDRIETSMTAYHRLEWLCGCTCEYSVGYITEWKGIKACNEHKFLEEKLNKDNEIFIIENDVLPKFIEDFLKHISRYLEKVKKNVLKKLEIKVIKSILEDYTLKFIYRKKDISLDVSFDKDGKITSIAVCPAETTGFIMVCDSIMPKDMNDVDKIFTHFVNYLNE